MSNFWKSKKVVVTGASGFLGSRAVEMLVAKGATVTAHVSSVHGTPPKNLLESSKNIKLVNGNLEDFEKAMNAVKNQDIVLNFAAMDGGSVFKKEHTAEIYKTNSRIIINMLEASRISGVKRFLQISSTEVYPEKLKQPMKESYGFMKGLNEKIDGYAWSKRFSEIACKLYASQYDLKISIVRPSNIYGPRDHLDKGRVVPTFIKQAFDNKPITVWNGGRLKKSFLYVDDFIVAALDVVEYYKKFDTYNIASGRYITIRQLAQEIIRLCESKSKIKDIETVDTVIKERVISISKVKEKIKFKEHIGLEDGLAETINYISSNYQNIKSKP